MRVFIDSPHRLLREGLVALIARRHELAEEASAEVAVKDLCGHSYPYPDPPALPTLALIYNREQNAAAIEVLRIGYRGYLGIEDGEERLERALQALLHGENWAERHVIAALFDQRGAPILTTRESQIYALAVTGLSNQEIATELGLSVNTVKVHMSNLLHKLDVKTRTELIIKSALKNGN